MLKVVKKVGLADQSHEDDIQALVAHDGKIYSGGEDGHVKVWSANLDYRTEFRPHDYAISALCFHDEILHTGSVDGSIRMWNPKDLTPLGELGTHQDAVTKLVSTDGNYLFSGGQDCMVKVWKDKMMSLVLSVVEEVFDMAIDGLTIVSVRDRGITVQELVSLTESERFNIKAAMEGKAPLAMGKKHLFAIASDGRGILKFDRSSYKNQVVLKGHELIVNCMKLSEDEKWLFSAGWDKIVNVWNAETDELVCSCNIGYDVQQMCLGNTPGEIVVGGSQGTIALLSFNHFK